MRRLRAFIASTVLVLTVGSLTILPSCNNESANDGQPGGLGGESRTERGGKSGAGGTHLSGGRSGAGGSRMSAGGLGGESSGDGGSSNGAGGQVVHSGGTGALGGSDAGDGGSSIGGFAGSPSTETTSTGTVNGVSFRAVDVLAMSISTPKNGVAVEAVLVEFGGICLHAIQATRRHEDFADYRALTFALVDPGDLPLMPGMFKIRRDVPSEMGRYAIARFRGNDEQCELTPEYQATSGTIDLQHMDSLGIAGSFSLTFESGDSLKGEFSTPFCNELLTTEKDPAAPSAEICLPAPK
jgi:hypothetical protein